MFAHYNEKAVNCDTIDYLDYQRLRDDGLVRIVYKNGEDEFVEGPEAVQLVMQLAPSALEGERLKYHRHAWAIHNLIGHPLMQIFSWLHLTRLGIKIHDLTVPNPITK